MYEYEEDHDSSWSFAIGLFVGAVAGAVAASVLTPRSGPQNREFVRERGLVLKDRVTDTTQSVTGSVRGTTQGAVATVRGTTQNAVATVREAADTAVTKVSGTVETVREKASETVGTVREKASETVGTVREKASAAAEKVSETTQVAVEKVQHVAEVATEKAQGVAETATEKVRSLTGRSDEIEVPLPSTTGDVGGVVSYDSEDARPLASDAGSTPSTLLDTVDESWREATHDTGASRDAATTTSFESFGAGDLGGARAYESSSVVGEPLIADESSPLVQDAAPIAAEESPSGLDRDALSTLSSLDTFEPTMPSIGPVPTTGDTETRPEVREASAELASDEQFEVAENDPRESSEGTDRMA